MRAQANGIEIEFETRGDERCPAVLLIMGLGAQLVRWPESLVQGLVEIGLRVVRFDNRDCGMSSAFPDGGVPKLEAIIDGSEQPPYTLDDMARDAIGLMDWLEIEKAHIVGTSMGGMIGQLLASDFPDRVLSLTSIMSTTGNPDLSPSNPDIFEKLTQPRPDPLQDLPAYLDHEVWRASLISSPAYPSSPSNARACALLEYERGYNPDGAARQMAAIFSHQDRRVKLRSIRAPTLIVHGLEDPLIPPDGGEDCANTIPDSRLILIPGMAHDLPDDLMPVVSAAIGDIAGVSKTKGASKTG